MSSNYKENQREKEETEQIIEIETERLRDFLNHPFKIAEDYEMKD